MAAEPKTKPTDVPVAGFIAAIEPASRRPDAEALCALLGEASGEAPVMWGTSIVGFGSYRGKTGDWPLIGFSPRKANLTIYIMPEGEAFADLLAQLGKHKVSGSCLHVNRMSDIDPAVLRELAERSVAWMRERYPTGA